MRSTSQILFQEALATAIQITERLGTTLADDIVLVRDLRGRIRPVLPTKPQGHGLQQYRDALARELGAYGFEPGRVVLDEPDKLYGAHFVR